MANESNWSDEQSLLRHMQLSADGFDAEKRDAWARVLSLSKQLYKKKAWSYLTVDNLISIERASGSREQTIVSMMAGSNGIPSVQFYLGDWGLWSLRYLLDREEDLSARLVSRLLSRLDAYRLDYLMRADIPDDYAAFCRDLGLSFRGDWPYLTVIEPNKPLSYPETTDLLHMEFVLEQLLLTLNDIELKHLTFSPDSGYMLRRSWSEADKRWLYTQEKSAPDIYLETMSVDDELFVMRMKRLPQTQMELSLDLFRFRQPVMDEDGVYINMYLFIASDDISGEVVFYDTVRSDVSEYAAWPDFLIALLTDLGKPALIQLDDEIALACLDPFLDAIGVPYVLLRTNPLHDFIYEDISKQMH